jgi:hypothetical protein
MYWISIGELSASRPSTAILLLTYAIACGLISETLCINPLDKSIVNHAHIGFIILTVMFNILAPLFIIFRNWKIKNNAGYPSSPSQQRATGTIGIMVQTVVLYVIVAVGILPHVIPQLIRATAMAALLEIVMQSGVVSNFLIKLNVTI